MGPTLRSALFALATACALALVPAAATPQGSVRDLGVLPGGTESRAYAVTADGTVVVGECWVGGARRAFRWTPARGMQDLFPGTAYDVSADGAVVVGQRGLYGGVATRWSEATGAVDLDLFGASTSIAYTVSADGLVIGGVAEDPAGQAQAFRWTSAGGVQGLGPGTVLDMSADGAVLVGNSGLSGEINGSAFRWTAATGTLSLGLGWSTARAVSGDGRVVYANKYIELGPSHGSTVVVRWTEADGGVRLDLVAASVYGTNSDGSVLVGGGAEPFRWTALGGRVDLVGLPNMRFAFDVNADGSVIVGGFGRAFYWRSSAFGERYCTPVANSTGRGGLIDANGSHLAQANDLRLSAEFLPEGALGCFLVSCDAGEAYPVHHSQGRLCLGGFVGRFVGPGQVLSAGLAGRFALTVDLGALPTPFGPVAALPGDTWHFQAWHRDANPASTSNFTDAIRVTLR